MNLSTTNITNDKLHPKDTGSASIVVYVILLVISGIQSITSISYIIVCFRIFSKEFNKLLILCLCLSGSILGFSTVWYSVLSIFKSVLFNPLSCSFSIFLMSFGLFLSYSFLLILNLASFFTIRSYNYGIQQKLNSIKSSLFSGVLIGSFLISCSTWFIPHSPVITTCNSVSLFGEHYNIFVIVVIGTVGMLLCASVITSVLVVKQIYQTFAQKEPSSKAIFFRSNQVEAQIVDEDKMETNASPHEHSREVFTFSTHSLSNEDGARVTETSPHNLKTTPTIQDSNQKQKALPEFCVEGRKISTNQNVGSTRQGKLTKQQSFIFNKKDTPAKQNAKPGWKSWERNAFITNILITFISVVLTGPFIGMMLASIVVDDISYNIGFITFVLFILNGTINPFIFAWRIPEIRQQLKNVCQRN